MSALLRDLYCGLTKNHFVKEPIRLSCGHCICKKCVPDQVNIKGQICSKETDISKLEINKESANYIFDHTHMIHHHHLFGPNEYSSSPAYFNLLYLKLFLS